MLMGMMVELELELGRREVSTRCLERRLMGGEVRGGEGDLNNASQAANLIDMYGHSKAPCAFPSGSWISRKPDDRNFKYD